MASKIDHPDGALDEYKMKILRATLISNAFILLIIALVLDSNIEPTVDSLKSGLSSYSWLEYTSFSVKDNFDKLISIMNKFKDSYYILCLGEKALAKLALQQVRVRTGRYSKTTAHIWAFPTDQSSKILTYGLLSGANDIILYKEVGKH